MTWTARPGTRVAAAGLSAAVALSLVACGAEATRDVKESARWRTSQAPVDTTGLIWSVGTTVNFPDGTVIDMGTEVHGYLVAGDGVFFFPQKQENGESAIHDRELWFAAPDEEPEATGLVVDEDGVVASPDGQHLAAVLVDDDDGMGDATVVGYDLTTGEEWHSEDGMDGPVDEIDEFEVQATGVDNDYIYGMSLDGPYAWDLATGEGEEVTEDEFPIARQKTSPDGEYQITNGKVDDDTIETIAGQAVPLGVDNGTARFGFWVNADTAVGLYVSQKRTPEGTDEDFVEVITCQVPSGECEVHHEIQGDVVTFPMQGDDGRTMGLYQISGFPEE